MVVWYHPFVWIFIIVVSLILLYITYSILKFAITGIISIIGRIYGGIVSHSASSNEQSKSTTSKQQSVTNPKEPKYPHDPDAQRAHEEAQARKLEDTLTIGREYDTVTLEDTGNSQGNAFRANLFGVSVFIDENVPDSVVEGDKIRVQVTHFSGKMNAAHARFVSF